MSSAARHVYRGLTRRSAPRLSAAVKTHSWKSDAEFAEYLRHLTQQAAPRGAAGASGTADPGVRVVPHDSTAPASAPFASGKLASRGEEQQIQADPQQSCTTALQSEEKREAFFSLLLQKIDVAHEARGSADPDAVSKYASRALAIVKSDLCAKKFARYLEVLHKGNQEGVMREAIPSLPALVAYYRDHAKEKLLLEYEGTRW
eukprot:g3753.t1